MVIAYLRVGTSNKELLEEQKDEIERYASNHDMMSISGLRMSLSTKGGKMNVILLGYWIVCKKAIV